MALWLGRDDVASQGLAGKSATTIHEVVASAGAVYSTTFPDVDGHAQRLGQWEKRFLLVNFWATWCGPCKEEMPIFVKLQSRFSGQNLQIVGIAADSSLNVANFAKKTPVNYPLLIDETGAIQFSKRLGNRLGLLPHTVLFRPGGEVIYNRLGVISERELSDIIAKNTSIVSKSD
jgi:thiol-disulfide isomerase/thioredoxin